MPKDWVGNSCYLYFIRVSILRLVNRQGNDIGPQYRTGIYYTDPKEKSLIFAVASTTAKSSSGPHRG
ncbi:MAG: peptide-methionine (S)-S-oxide reductase [Clostridia bacterium]